MQATMGHLITNRSVAKIKLLAFATLVIKANSKVIQLTEEAEKEELPKDMGIMIVAFHQEAKLSPGSKINTQATIHAPSTSVVLEKLDQTWNKLLATGASLVWVISHCKLVGQWPMTDYPVADTRT